MPNNLKPHSPAPWSYGYNPYTVQSDSSPLALGISAEIPAYEIFDADGNKLFDTIEDSDPRLQEANARLASAAPRLLAALMVCANLLGHHDRSRGEEDDAYREAMAAIAEAEGRSA